MMLLRKAWSAVLAGVVSTAALAQEPPPGWRFLVSADWPIDPERVKLSMLKARSDFNGDGKMDVARVLTRRAGALRAGVFVFLAGDGQAAHAEQLDQYDFAGGEFMLHSVSKGCYRSRKSKICLRSAGLVRSEIEYGWSTLYWLDKRKWRRMRFTRGEFSGL